MTDGRVVADPYPWPFDGPPLLSETALIIIDMQTDFCGEPPRLGRGTPSL